MKSVFTSSNNKFLLLSLCVLLVCMSHNIVEGRASVAALRRARALGWSNGHFGGDNGRDHPGAATVTGTTTPSIATEEQTDTTVSASMSNEADSGPMGTSNDVSPTTKACIGVAVGLGSVAALLVAFYLASKKKRAAKHSVGAVRATKSAAGGGRDDTDDIEEATAASFIFCGSTYMLSTG